ncbi:hypothetical protein E2C01_026639 [Portunus trituberculatus]|uniref:Uncharacterized protein n=1 Tax=Portunus trituberculatus TaxID=210409 RepID=A0A5B7EIQ2_PORTR|nr:hypothetical protein [Portunus trituberculatus]
MVYFSSPSCLCFSSWSHHKHPHHHHHHYTTPSSPHQQAKGAGAAVYFHVSSAAFGQTSNLLPIFYMLSFILHILLLRYLRPPETPNCTAASLKRGDVEGDELQD